MTPDELKVVMRFLARANPPAVLYRYRRASEWTLKEITTPEVYLTKVTDLNDPLEYRAPLAFEIGALKDRFRSYCKNELGMDHDTAEQEVREVSHDHVKMLSDQIDTRVRSSSGLICCTSAPHSNRMWAYYGDSHRGICVGYSTKFHPFCFARKVTYQDPEGPVDLLKVLEQDPLILSDVVSCRKGREWDFEHEYRIPVGPIPETAQRLIPILPESIIEIRLGVQISDQFRADVLAAAKQLNPRPRVIQMGCDRATFRLTETVVEI